MAVTVKKAILWRKELANRPGTLAEALKPLAEAGVSLQIVMGYAFPGEHEHAAVEVYPVGSAKAEQAAGQAGLEPSPSIACLLVQGDDKAGLGHAIAEKLAENGINISFVMVQVVARKYHGIFGFENQEDADRAVAIIKEAGKAAAPRARRRPSARKVAVRKTARKSAGRKSTARKPAKKSAAKKPAAKKSTTRRPKAKARKTKARKR
jgi:hypothetical protein